MLYIRTDINDTIATGHLMRCMAIADAAKDEGEDTTFLLADNRAVPLMEKRGFRYIVLRTKWNDMDAELPSIKKVIETECTDKLLIDSYQVTAHYLEELRLFTKTVYLDDLDAFHYPVDALICYANYWEDFHYTGRYPDTQLFLGPAYAPLRAPFRSRGKKQIKPQAENLLLLSGGSNHYDILNRILRKMERDIYSNIDVICGMYDQNYTALCSIYGNEHNIHIHRAVSDLEHYMERADLAISAGGTTLYELCALGVPSLSYSVADNQLKNVRKFQADGVIPYVGDVRTDDVAGNLNRLLTHYRQNAALRREMSEKMQKLVDGNGARRIVHAIRTL